jgi:hypothetical protein
VISYKPSPSCFDELARFAVISSRRRPGKLNCRPRCRIGVSRSDVVNMNIGSSQGVLS